MYNVVYVV